MIFWAYTKYLKRNRKLRHNMTTLGPRSPVVQGVIQYPLEVIKIFKRFYKPVRQNGCAVQVYKKQIIALYKCLYAGTYEYVWLNATTYVFIYITCLNFICLKSSMSHSHAFYSLLTTFINSSLSVCACQLLVLRKSVATALFSILEILNR